MIANGQEAALQSMIALCTHLAHIDTSSLELNARMRRIDLICKLVGPLFIALVDGASTKAAIWVTAGSNLIALPIEYFAIARVIS